jgi:hypothetical protein
MLSRNFKILIFVIFIIFIFLTFYYLNKTSEQGQQITDNKNYISDIEDNNSVEIIEEINIEDEAESEVSMSPDSAEGEIEAVNIDEDGNDKRTLASMEAQKREMPFLGIDGLGLEFMNDEEKEQFGIPLNNDVQIITRDFDGSISSYKIIYQQENIVYPN